MNNLKELKSLYNRIHNLDTSIRASSGSIELKNYLDGMKNACNYNMAPFLYANGLFNLVPIMFEAIDDLAYDIEDIESCKLILDFLPFNLRELPVFNWNGMISCINGNMLKGSMSWNRTVMRILDQGPDYLERLIDSVKDENYRTSTK